MLIIQNTIIILKVNNHVRMIIIILGIIPIFANVNGNANIPAPIHVPATKNIDVICLFIHYIRYSKDFF